MDCWQVSKTLEATEKDIGRRYADSKQVFEKTPGVSCGCI